MHFKKALILAAGLLVVAAPLWAQGTQSATAPTMMEHRVEIIPLGGYIWTVSQDATLTNQSGTQARTGELDIANSGFWGIALDFNLVPVAQLRLLYRRQDSDLTFKSAGTTDTVGELAVDYLQIGAVKGIVKGNVRPFTSFTLGATRYSSPDAPEDDWKFSIIIGLGAKIYLNERLGLMLGGNMPWTFTDAFLGIGTGGLSVGGSGIVQFDLAAGIMINV